MTESWARTRNFIAADFAVSDLIESDLKICVAVPALNEAKTIAPIVDCLVDLRESGAVHRVVLLDSDSTDDTARIAGDAGAEVVAVGELLPSFGEVRGKGDALWRSLSVLDGDVLCFFDGDLGSFDSDYVTGLCGPLIAEPEVQFVKATFDRPFLTDDRSATEEAGRLTQMAARPLISLLYPELAVFHQPLSGQFASRREFLTSLPFTTGYGVDIGLLIDAFSQAGLAGIAQSDIGTLHNRHRPIEDLSAMATQIYEAVFRRLQNEGRLDGELAPVDLETVERPPIASLHRV